MTAQIVGVANPYTFTGREFDPESGLIYYRARHYDLRSGRFLQQDPLGLDAGDANLYRYVFNSSPNLTDPFGLAAGGEYGSMAAGSAGTAVGLASIGLAIAEVFTCLANRIATALGEPSFYGSQCLTTGDTVATLALAAVPRPARGLGALGLVGSRLIKFNPARSDHIFRNWKDHINPVTAGSKARAARLFENVASNPANLRADAVQVGIIAPEAASCGGAGVYLNDEERRASLGSRQERPYSECWGERCRSHAMTLSDALAADRESRHVEAAAAYEDVLMSDPDNLEILLNLIVLYWRATDLGVAAGYNHPKGFMSHAGDRLHELLELANRRFPGRPEVFFWTKYIAWADLDEPFEPDECRKLLRDHPQYLEPAMALFSWTQGAEAEHQAMPLFSKCAGERTIRCRYMYSVIESVLNARRKRP